MPGPAALDAVIGARTRGRASIVALLLAVAMVGLLGMASSARADGVPLAQGDVLAATGNGIVKHFSPAGTLLDSLDTTTGASNTTGMCFDGSSNLYVTEFAQQNLSTFDLNGNLLAKTFGSGFNSDPESCTVDASNNIYVGQADGSADVLKFDSSGNLLASFSPATDARGTDWIDLSSDQCTLLYTGEGSLIKRFNVCTNTQMPDFASGLPGPCFELRIRPDGSVIVACASEAVLLDASGNIVQTYPLTGASELFAMNLDPDGTSFWTGDIFNGTVFHVDIASGNVLGQFNSSPGTQLGGLVIVGGIVVSTPTLTLAPPTQTQPVGSSAALTATLGTSSAPTPGATILFSVSGVNTGSGSGTTDVNGQAGFSYTGTNAGTDTVTACYDANTNGVCDPGEQTATAAVTWTTGGPPPPPSDQSITATAASPLTPTEGAAFTAPVASFTDPDTAAPASEYSATVNWGDGSTSAGSITGSGGSFTVNGSHTYAEEGPHTITVTITDVDTTSNAATASTSAKVADAALTASGVPTIHGANVNGRVATFKDADPGGTVSDYTASIQWGDGKTTAGTISAGFGVQGSHHYGRAGTFHITVTIRDAGGATATATSEVKVASTGTAKLRGIPSACVLNSFSASVTGKQIASVRFLLDGSKVASKTAHRGSRYTAMISLSPGSHHLTVKVTFSPSSHTRARTFHVNLSGCKVPVPKFTG